MNNEYLCSANVPRVGRGLRAYARSRGRSARMLVLFVALVLLYRFGLDGRGRFRGVVLLNVSCGSGDGTPGFATTDTNSEGAKEKRED